MPLGARVVLSVGSLLAVVVAVIAIALLLVVDQGHAERRLTRTSVPYASDLDRAALQAKGVANDERGFLMTGAVRFRREAAGRAAAAGRAFDAAVARAASPAQKAAVRQAGAGFDRWYAAVRREFRAYDAGARRSAVSAALGADRDLRKRYERSLTDARRLASQAVDAEASSLARRSSRSAGILLGLLGVVLIAGIVVSVWIVRSVLRPVHRLVELIARADDVRAR